MTPAVADDEVSELERRWRDTGAVGDEAAYLRARVRAGTLSEERLRLAAALGSRAARALGVTTADIPDSRAGRIAAVLAVLDRPARVALACRCVTDMWPHDLTDDVVNALTLARAWAHGDAADTEVHALSSRLTGAPGAARAGSEPFSLEAATLILRAVVARPNEATRLLSQAIEIATIPVYTRPLLMDRLCRSLLDA